jgi:hypothetical protein
MENNKSPFAIVQIGVGIICLLIGIIIFLSFEVNYVLGATLLFLGTGILLHGVTNNNTDKSEKGKMLSLIATICVVIASGLIFYNMFFNSK